MLSGINFIALACADSSDLARMILGFTEFFLSVKNSYIVVSHIICL